MKRSTPIKDQFYKTDIYLKHKRLIYKLANKYYKVTNLDFEDLVSEFNVIFCEAIRKYDSDKSCFSTYLTICCKTHAYNLIVNKNTKKRSMEVLESQLIINSNNQEDQINLYEYFASEFDVLEKVILYDNLHNNKNLVIQSIVGILSTYKIPENGFTVWLKTLLKTYGHKDPGIQWAFKKIKELY